jgi:hypothetical protein
VYIGVGTSFRWLHQEGDDAVVRTSYFTILTAIALLGVLAGSSGAAAGDTTRISVDTSGAEANGESYGIISSDGRYVAFDSYASNLVAGDANGESDVFVRDLQTGTTELVSGDDSGNPSNFASYGPSMSADGRYVVFTSQSTNLVADDDTKAEPDGFVAPDAFVHDRDTGTTERVSVDGSGTGANGWSYGTFVSDDGRYVAFYSTGSNLVQGDTNGTFDAFVRDRELKTTERVSVDGSGTGANSSSYSPSMSADGRYVAFDSYASNLVEGDTNGHPDVFVRDRELKTTEWVSMGGSGAQGDYYSWNARISADGRYVAFDSGSSNLVAGDSNDTGDVFVHDRDTGTTERVSVPRCGPQGNGDSQGSYISADGRYVTFTSSASNLVGGDTNGVYDSFVRDRDTGTTERVSVDGSGVQGNGDSYGTSISSDGRYVAFDSGSSNLVGGDTNGVFDVFVHERDTPPSNDCIAPSTTVSATTTSGAVYKAGMWTNEDVKATFSAKDNDGGSGIMDIRYSATGAQNITEASYDSQNPPLINTEGTTTLRYYATDNAGNKEYPKTFTVKLDKSAPTVTGTIPTRDQNGVASNINPSATFSEKMDPTSITNSSFTLTKQGGSTIGASVAYDTSTNKATLTPNAALDPNATYTATIKSGSGGAKDAAGNPLAQDYTWSFTTAPPPETTAPTVVSTTPSSGQTGVARNTNLVAKFSERMEPTSTITSFKLNKCSSTACKSTSEVTDVGVTLSSDGITATLDPFPKSPTTLLESKTTYKAIVTTGAKDVASNALDQYPSTSGNQQKEWTFTTGSK